jgi:hypothetical protein
MEFFQLTNFLTLGLILKRYHSASGNQEDCLRGAKPKEEQKGEATPGFK